MIIILPCSHNAVTNILGINIMIDAIIDVDEKKLVFQERV